MSQSQSTPLPQCNSTLCPDQQMLPITGISTGLQSIPNPFVSANPTSFVQNPYYHLLHIPLHHLQQSPGYSSLPNPLGDTSSTVLNSATTPTPSRKHKKTKQSTHGAKRLKNTTTGPPSSSCGIGPSTSTHVMSTTVPSASGTPPLASYTNPHGKTTAEDVLSSTPFLPNTTTNVVPETIGLPSKLTSHRASAATDVWYFLHPLDTEEEPSVWPNPEIEPRLTEKPTSQFVGCKLCTNSWKTWKHRGCKSMTSCYRTHLQSNHFNVWESTVRTLGLKGSTDKGKKSGNATLRENGVFSKEVFYQLLMRWLVIDDQSLNVVECDEFRDLILYLAGDDLDDDELVHRTKLRTDILLEQKKVFIKLREDLLVTCFAFLCITPTNIIFSACSWASFIYNRFME
ncbi:hypothetical protein BDQ17DRAFT_189904 [Cyathus striatus]|nr:hypothetical protein BDQ17DRAFT_189904 [Cyathus striatus]